MPAEDVNAVLVHGGDVVRNAPFTGLCSIDPNSGQTSLARERGPISQLYTAL